MAGLDILWSGKRGRKRAGQGKLRGFRMKFRNIGNGYSPHACRLFHAATVFRKALSRSIEIVRRRALEMQRLAGDRMLESEGGGVERLPAERSERRLASSPSSPRLGLEARAIDRVAQERMADRGHMNADLMRAAGLQFAGDEACRSERLLDPPMGDGVAAALPPGRSPFFRADGGGGRWRRRPFPPRRRTRPRPARDRRAPASRCGRGRRKDRRGPDGPRPSWRRRAGRKCPCRADGRCPGASRRRCPKGYRRNGGSAH